MRETAVEPTAKLQRSEWGIEIDYQEHANDLRTYMLWCGRSRTGGCSAPGAERNRSGAWDGCGFELEVGQGNRYAKGSGGRYAITQEQPFWVDSGSVGACRPGCGTSFGVLERNTAGVAGMRLLEATHMLFPRPPDAATAAVAAGKSPGARARASRRCCASACSARRR